MSIDLTPEGFTFVTDRHLATLSTMGPGGLIHTVAVGDQRNDLEMLHWAARGVAMGNAPDEVKAVADETTLDVDDDGLVPVLQSLL